MYSTKITPVPSQIPDDRGSEYKEWVLEMLRTHDINEAKKIISGVGHEDITEWGNPEYAGAYSIFKTLRILFDLFIPFKEISIFIEIDIGNDLDEKLEQWKEQMIFRQQDMSERDIMDVKNVSNFNEAFYVMRGMGLDLWTAVDIVFRVVYSTGTMLVPVAPAIGPKCNHEMQKKNNMIGVKCYVLRMTKVVTSSRSFANFRTP